MPRSARRACLIECFCAYPRTEGSFDAFRDANELVVRVVDMLTISSSILDGSDASKHVRTNPWYIPTRQFEYRC